MAKLARLPTFDRPAEAEASSRVPRLRTRYYAFLSYSHKDKEVADWLHRELERFRVPHALAGKLTANGVVPRRLMPIFRDQQDLSAGADLGEEIKAALAGSQFLIVLCSPTAAKSRWTNAEIESFKRTRPEGCVLAAVVSGEPFASDMPGREHEECFPPALRFKYDRRGHQTAKRAEPLAADFRETGEGRRMAFLKLVAGMLGVGLDELVQRETTRRHRHMAWLAAGSLAGMAITSALALTAIQARDAARDQRREAEGLVAFMLGDLKDKLEPIGKLDALDGVGSRVLAYYGKQDMADLSDAALLQRSRALSLMADVSSLRGDTENALGLYREAMAGTAEAIRRNPNDPKRLFDHAQNLFYVSQVALKQGRLANAERALREYKRLALKMVALDPDNMKWRMEEQYAEADLGAVLYIQRQYSEAAAQFFQALRTIEALSTADPRNSEFQQSLAETLAWLADARMAEGQLTQATELRERQVALLERLLTQSGGNVIYRQKLIPARRSLGNLYAVRGQLDRGLQQFRAAVDQVEKLNAIEPDNTLWLQFGYNARLDFGRNLLINKDNVGARTQADAACQIVARLLTRDSRRPEWRAGQRDCWALKAQIALANRATDEALADAQKAVNVAKSVKSNDPVGDRFALATTYRIFGDVMRARGNQAGARAAWTAGLAVLPGNAAERPFDMSQHAGLLLRLGKRPEAQALTSKLNSIGYRSAV